VPYMAKLSIGPGWNSLTPEQKKQAAHAYGRYIAATYASRFDGFSGERLEVLGEQKIKRGTMVQSRIVKSDGEPVSINYMVHDNAVGYQIRDVYVTGTISELATKRSEFATILRTNGIDGLIASLNKKADDLRGFDDRDLALADDSVARFDSLACGAGNAGGQTLPAARKHRVERSFAAIGHRTQA